jgi:SNF2 family DNA or RNA helicase
MKVINNVNVTLKDDLLTKIKRGSKLNIAAASFSIYAYRELKAELSKIDSLHFIFTSPTFTTEKAPKEKREFYIPRKKRESDLYGTEYEVKLRNELTQKAIAKECAEWIKSKATFKSNKTNEIITPLLSVDNEDKTCYTPINGFTTSDLGCAPSNNMLTSIICMENVETKDFLANFETIWNNKEKLEDVTSQVIDNITVAYRENSPEFIYFVALYNIFSEFLEDITEDVLPNEATGFKSSKIWHKLYDFQKQAALAIINKLEKFNGCILADSVGLGKTFTALAVIKYYENRNKNVLVLCPKKLQDNWQTFKSNYKNNPVAEDRLRYDVLFHTDLSRDHGFSGAIDLSKINWSNYDLVVLDESHNFRNGGSLDLEEDEKENRYQRLMNRVIREGVKTKVLMLSATPVNNGFNDLKNQIALAYEGKSDNINQLIGIKTTIEDVFRQAQTAYNKWRDLPLAQRTTDALLQSLSFDFFKVLDSVTIARSRKHIQTYYDASEIGNFPKRLKPISYMPPLTDLKGQGTTYKEIYELLGKLNLSVYVPSYFLQPSKRAEYFTIDEKASHMQIGREFGLRKLMATNLLKRLESSVQAFKLTLERMRGTMEISVNKVNTFTKKKNAKAEVSNAKIIAETDDDFDLNEEEAFFTVGKVKPVKLEDMDYLSWQRDIETDIKIITQILSGLVKINPAHDAKLDMLKQVIQHKVTQPFNAGNRKILLFTAFSDTAQYLYDNLTGKFNDELGLHVALITGTNDPKCTDAGIRKDFNTVLTCFSPISKERELLMPGDKHDIDLLIATDCISEGQNLQDCDCVINYDIHWNPVRIIQRFGRIDRIGSFNSQILMICFWPNVSLDEYIKLRDRVLTKMKITVLTSTGTDNPLEETDYEAEYRRQQLQKLQEEVVDLEDVNGGISIVDLGLNDFRLDLLEYMKKMPDAVENAAKGMHAVTAAKDKAPAGVFYILKSLTEEKLPKNKNQLHPYYLVYVDAQGNTICDYLHSKKFLDALRYLCKGIDQPNKFLCAEFNKETHDGKDMDAYSMLLNDAINSILDTQEESDIDSLFTAGGTTALTNTIKGLDDFELICFLVVK